MHTDDMVVKSLGRFLNKIFVHYNFSFSGDMPKKRKRGRPTKSETLARRQAEKEEAEERKAAKVKATETQQAEDEEDDVVDAGAIDDLEGQYERFNKLAYVT